MREKQGPKGRRQRISKEEMAVREEAIIEDIRAGEMSYRQIAAKHGVSLPTVNNKARKAGISRGRRKAGRPAAAPARKAAARGGAARTGARKTVRKATKKAARRGRPPRSESAGSPTTKARRAVRPARRATGARRGRPPGIARATAGFTDDLRELVLRHFPGISLLAFERISKAVEEAVR